MLISGVDVEGPGGGGGRGAAGAVEEQTFEIIEAGFNCELNESEFRPRSDLILIYKNIDISSETVSDRRKRPNQLVETVVHDDGDDSDNSCNEDLDTLFVVNDERLDLLGKASQNNLCQRLRGINPTNDLAAEYQHFFRNPLIKDQLNKLNNWQSTFEFSTILPTTLLDYICAKSFDDNYNFYMDNVISYVKRTIDQLKRISNGEFLTERAKEKWRKVEARKEISENNMKILSTSASIPKVTEELSKWDNIIRSEVNLRSLCNMLEKKIFLNVPRMISGSYNIFEQDMTISCQVGRPTQVEKSSPRFDLVVHIENAESKDAGNVNPIMIMCVNDNSALTNENIEPGLPVASHAISKDMVTDEPLIKVNERISIDVLTYNNEQKTHRSIKSNVSIIELDDNGEPLEPCHESKDANEEQSLSENNLELNRGVSESSSDFEFSYSDLFRPQEDINGNSVMITPYELSISMHKLNIQKPLQEVEEASSKRTSPTRVRIKSPYENKSYILEEKKRKKLLDIRARREKKKMAVLERSKAKKQKLNKASVMPHASSSVTRLSITNKAFYNSIYGDNVNSNKPTLKNKKELHLQMPNNSDEDEDIGKVSLSSAEHDKIQYVNRSYYLDDAETEMQINQSTMNITASTTSDSDGINLVMDRPPLTPKDDDPFTITVNAIRVGDKLDNENTVDVKDNPSRKRQKDKKNTLSLECKKSIDRIYNLLRKISDSDNSVKVDEIQNDTGPVDPENSTIIASDSGTSVKHHLTSNPSSYSFATNSAKKKYEGPAAVVPKVIINTKTEAKANDNRKKLKPADNFVKDNPLKAISQLLHSIDNVNKNRQKSAQDVRIKPIRKIEAGDNRGVQRQVTFRKVDLREKKFPERVLSPKRFRPPSIIEENKIDKNKKLIDLVDEVKEARGEAVKGPKTFARLNALSQPKRSYVAAQHEDIKSRFGRSMVTERLQRLVETPPSVAPKPIPVNRKMRRVGENMPAVKAVSAAPLSSPGQRAAGSPARASCSPDRPHGSPERPHGSHVRPHGSPVRPHGSPVRPHGSHGRLAKPPLDECDDITKKPLSKKTNSRRSSPETEVRRTLSPHPQERQTTSRTPTPLKNQLDEKLHKIITEALRVTSRRALHSGDADLKKSSPKDLFIIKEAASSTQDFPVDIFADKTVVTAVENIADCSDVVDAVKQNNKLPTKSIIDLKRLENALYSQMFTGTFQKRLRIKNFTLSPKHSMHQIVLLQSGDSSSPLRLSTSKSETFVDIKSVLSKPSFDIMHNLPMQVTTVGYAFPKYDKDVKKIIEVTDDDDEDKDITVNQTTQGNQVNCESISELSSKAKANGKLSRSEPVFFIKNYDKEALTQEDTEDNHDTVVLEKKQEDNNETEKVLKDVRPKTNHVDCTSSLDILVKLLGEIQNITTKQTDLTKIYSCKDLTATQNESKPLENNLRDIVSLTSLEHMRQLDSSQSLYSFYLSNGDDREIRRIKMLVPFYEDKGVSVDVRRELVNNFTDVPSMLFPAVCHSTGISDSFFGIMEKASSHSIALTECQSYSNILLQRNKVKVKELKDDKSDFSESSIVAFRNKLEIVEAKRKAEKVKIKVVHTDDIVEETNMVEEKVKSGKVVELAHGCPMMKVKRDILVTVYSVLVLTVFAALSFPGVVF